MCSLCIHLKQENAYTGQDFDNQTRTAFVHISEALLQSSTLISEAVRSSHLTSPELTRTQINLRLIIELLEQPGVDVRNAVRYTEALLPVNTALLASASCRLYNSESTVRHLHDIGVLLEWITKRARSEYKRLESGVIPALRRRLQERQHPRISDLPQTPYTRAIIALLEEQNWVEWKKFVSIILVLPKLGGRRQSCVLWQ